MRDDESFLPVQKQPADVFSCWDAHIPPRVAATTRPAHTMTDCVTPGGIRRIRESVETPLTDVSVQVRRPGKTQSPGLLVPRIVSKDETSARATRLLGRFLAGRPRAATRTRALVRLMPRAPRPRPIRLHSQVLNLKSDAKSRFRCVDAAGIDLEPVLRLYFFFSKNERSLQRVVQWWRATDFKRAVIAWDLERGALVSAPDDLRQGRAGPRVARVRSRFAEGPSALGARSDLVRRGDDWRGCLRFRILGGGVARVFEIGWRNKSLSCPPDGAARFGGNAGCFVSILSSE